MRDWKCTWVSNHCRYELNLSIFTLLFTFSLAQLNFPAQAVTTHDDELDISALDAFCHIVKNEPEISSTAARLLAFRAQVDNTKEALLALDAFEGKLFYQCDECANFMIMKILENSMNFSLERRRMYGRTRTSFSE